MVFVFPLSKFGILERREQRAAGQRAAERASWICFRRASSIVSFCVWVLLLGVASYVGVRVSSKMGKHGNRIEIESYCVLFEREEDTWYLPFGIGLGSASAKWGWWVL